MSITEVNYPVTQPDTMPGMAYHYRTFSTQITAGNVAIIYIPYQVANHGISIVFTDPTNTQLDVSVSLPDTIHAAPSTAGTWATNVNSGHAAFYEISGSITAMRFTNGSGATVTVEANVG